MKDNATPNRDQRMRKAQRDPSYPQGRKKETKLLKLTLPRLHAQLKPNLLVGTHNHEKTYIEYRQYQNSHRFN